MKTINCFIGFLLLLLSPVVDAQSETDYYPTNFDKSQDYTRNDRRLTGVVLTGANGAAQTISIPSPQKVYSLVDSPVFTASAGEKVTATFNYSGSWMHGYVYLDQGQDGAFNTTLNSDCSIPEGSDVMAFSYVEPVQGSGKGYNSKGESLSSPNTLNPPSFTIPANLPNGFYRMRYKVDWASNDAGGRREDGNGILKNGGAICDVRINIHGEYSYITASASDNGTLSLADGTSINGYKHPFGKPLAINVTPADGYMCDAIEILHGYNLDGESHKCGVAQNSLDIIPGYQIADNKLEIPASMLDGDVRLQAKFVKMADDDSSDNYSLSFDANEELTNSSYRIKSFEVTSSDGAKKSISIPQNSKLYNNLTKNEVCTTAGATINCKVSAENEGMHYYLYVDYNNDGKFSVATGDNAHQSMSSELVSYTWYDGKNSKGEHVDATSSSLPSFTLSPMLSSGKYRVRLKADKNDVSSAGSSGITANGGQVVAFILNVCNGDYSLTLNTVNGNIYDGYGWALPLKVSPYTPIEAVAKPVAQGYVLSTLKVKHGYNFDGPQYINGNCQWSEYTPSDESFTIPADSVNGDIEITAEYRVTADAEYRLVFSDEFNAQDYSQPVDEKWMRCKRYSSTWNRWLSDSKEVVYIKDGNLVARAIPNPDTSTDNVPMITGGIKSNGRFGFTYGYVECRILTNPYSGNFPAFWMMPEEQSAGWPDCGEIDIWEAIDAQNHTWHTIHSNWTYDLGNKHNPKSSFDISLDLSCYHTYGLEWSENLLIWYVDGNEVGRYAKSTIQSYLDKGQWPFDKHFHLILNQSVGDGSWAAPADVSHTYETLFDWVRVYQKEGMQNSNGTVGVAVVECADSMVVVAVEKGISVAVTKSSDVKVFDMTGRIVAEAVVDDIHTFQLPQGVYVVNGTKLLVK